jgi:hypothetical protein
MKRLLFAALIAGCAALAGTALAQTVNSSAGTADVGSTTSVNSPATSAGQVLTPDGGIAQASADGGTQASSTPVPAGFAAPGVYSFDPPPVGTYSFSITTTTTPR